LFFRHFRASKKHGRIFVWRDGKASVDFAQIQAADRAPVVLPTGSNVGESSL